MVALRRRGLALQVVEAPENALALLLHRDHLDLPRIAMRYDPRQAGRLRGLINAINDLPSAQGTTTAPSGAVDQASP